MTPETILLAAFALTIASVLFWKLAWPRLAIPRGIHIGPIIGGKTRSVGMPKYLDKQNGFDFPPQGKHINAIVSPTAKVGGTITLRYRIDAAEGVTFHPQENPPSPATVSLMLQRKGDDYSAKGAKAFYRLYGPGPQKLAPGEHTLTVEPRSLGWIGVMNGEPSPAQWDDVLSNLYAIHIAFGSYGGRAHGVFAAGKARFTLLSLGL